MLQGPPLSTCAPGRCLLPFNRYGYWLPDVTLRILAFVTSRYVPEWLRVKLFLILSVSTLNWPEQTSLYCKGRCKKEILHRMSPGTPKSFKTAKCQTAPPGFHPQTFLAPSPCVIHAYFFLGAASTFSSLTSSLVTSTLSSQL